MAPSLPSLALVAALSLLPSASADLRSRLASAGIDALFPGDSGFTTAATPFNKRLTFQPAAIAYPDDAEGVSKVVLAGAAENVSVNARGGGHSYTAYGLGGASGHLIVDLSRLTSITVSAGPDFDATVGSGNRLGEVAVALNAVGSSGFSGNASTQSGVTPTSSTSRAVAHGTCPYVGIGGHAAFGGFGFLSRLRGLTIDSVTAHQVVLANGSIVTASSNSNPDLYWALRGAGPSFGIVTAYTLQTYPAPTSASVFHYDYDLSINQTAKALSAYQAYVLNGDVPAEIGMEINLGQGSAAGRVSFSFAGAYYGDANNLNGIIQPLLSQLPTPQSSSAVNTSDWITSLAAIADGQSLLPSSPNVLSGEHDTFYAKSLVTPSPSVGAAMSDASLQAFAAYMGNQGYSSDTQWFVQVELYGGKESKIVNVDPDATSFASRNQLFTIQFYASSSNYAPPYPSDGFSFLDGMVNTITSNNPSDWPYGAYANYVDDQLTAQEWQKLYYNDHYARLSTIKAAYDPSNVFNFPQAILPASSGSPSSTSSSPSSTSPAVVTSGGSNVIASSSTPVGSTTSAAPSSKAASSAIKVSALQVGGWLGRVVAAVGMGAVGVALVW